MPYLESKARDSTPAGAAVPVVDAVREDGWGASQTSESLTCVSPGYLRRSPGWYRRRGSTAR